MNLPNKLTLARVIMIPIFLIFLYWDFATWHILAALAVFAIASYTDMLDGKIARKHNLITDFGKFLDPLADKVLVVAAIVAFIEFKWVGAIPVIIILFREFMVTSLRLVANNKEGKVIAAAWLGKVKTAFTMVAIVIILLLEGIAKCGVEFSFELRIVNEILIWIAALLTAVSGGQYLSSYWGIIDADK